MTRSFQSPLSLTLSPEERGQGEGERHYTLILTLSPLSHLSIHSFSCDGVNPVRTGSHGPRAPMPPSSAFWMRTNVDFGVVFTAWLSTSNPNFMANTCFFFEGSESS